jgi:hypothetical protein
MVRSRLGGVVLAAAAVGAIVIAAASPAQAFIARAYEGSDYASYSTSDGWLEVCDMERDGHGVYGEFWQGGVLRKVGDPNGSAGGCGNGHIAGVDRFRVCESGGDWPTCSDLTYIVALAGSKGSSTPLKLGSGS